MKNLITFCLIFVFALLAAESSPVKASENKSVSKPESAKILVVGSPQNSLVEEISQRLAAVGVQVIFVESVPKTETPIREDFPLILKTALPEKFYESDAEYPLITTRDAYSCSVKSFYRRPMNINPYNGVNRNIQPRALL